jgi:hypothetical protein
MAPQRYRVSEAILSPRPPSGSAWTITFAPLAPDPGAQFDPDHGKQIVVTLPASVVEEMSFVETYTRAEIEALSADGT